MCSQARIGSFDKKGKFLPDEKVAVEVLQNLGDVTGTGRGNAGSWFHFRSCLSGIWRLEKSCVAGADWYGLDLFQQFAWNGGIMGNDAITTQKSRWYLRSPNRNLCWSGLMICKATKNKDTAWKFQTLRWRTKRQIQKDSFRATVFLLICPPEEQDLLGEHPYFKQSMGELLVELSMKYHLVVDPRHQAIFLMQENYFSSVLVLFPRRKPFHNTGRREELGKGNKIP